MGKKWYRYFVVADESANAADPAATEGDEPQRASDLVPQEDVDPAVPNGPQNAGDLGEVYAAAKIAAPSHGYTVLKVAEMLRSEHIRSLATDVKRKSILVALDAAGVKVTDIVEDAVKRDRALDTYERVLAKTLEARVSDVAAENKRLDDEITKQIAELRAKIDENTRALDAEQREFQTWQQQKRQEEAMIADAVSYFVSENPVTVNRMPMDKGEADVR